MNSLTVRLLWDRSGIVTQKVMPILAYFDKHCLDLHEIIFDTDYSLILYAQIRAKSFLFPEYWLPDTKVDCMNLNFAAEVWAIFKGRNIWNKMKLILQLGKCNLIKLHISVALLQYLWYTTRVTWQSLEVQQHGQSALSWVNWLLAWDRAQWLSLLTRNYLFFFKAIAPSVRYGGQEHLSVSLIVGARKNTDAILVSSST
jgi:hypothetical protein